MNKPSDMSLYDEKLIEYILSLELKPIKPPKEWCSGGLFSIDYPIEKSYPLPGDKNGLTYDYWGGLII